MLKRKVSCTFKRKNALDNQERIYPLPPSKRTLPNGWRTQILLGCSKDVNRVRTFLKSCDSRETLLLLRASEEW